MPDVTITELGGPTHRRVAEPIVVGVALAGAASVATLAAFARWGPAGVAVVAAAIAAVSIASGIGVHHPSRPASWALVAVGCAIQAVATAGLVGRDPGVTAEGRWLPSAIAVLAYPPSFVGVVGLTTRRPSSWWTKPSAAIATAAIGTAVMALAFTAPLVARDRGRLAGSDWVGVLALCDFVLALVVVRRVIGAPRRNWSWWLLVAGFVAWGNAHAEVGAQIRDGTFDGDPLVTLALVAGPLLVGLAGFVPTMADAPPPRPNGERRAAVAGWAWSLALPPAALVVVRTADVDASRLWIATTLVAVVGVAVVRTVGRLGRLGENDEAAEHAHPARPARVRPVV